MKSQFENKIVWITGGGSGLGKAMALEFAREGAMVSVSGRRKDKLEATVGAIKAEGAVSKTVAVSTNPRVERTKERKLLGIHNLILKPHTRASLLTEVKSALNSIHSSQS